MKHKILVIDDDLNICKLLKQSLSKENYEVVTTQIWDEGLVMFKVYEPDLVLLDIVIPKKDGLEICRQIRAISSKPIIIITAKGEEFDKFITFEVGVDDFIVKPFSIKELCARIKAVLRRTANPRTEMDFAFVKFENFEISMQTYQLKINNIIVDVSPIQFELLYFLTSNINRVFTREQIFEKVWRTDYYGNSRIVDAHIKRLREKLVDISDKCKIRAIWGVGYKFELTL